MHRTHLVAMHATGQDAALARPCSLGDRHRHVPVLSGWHLNALKYKGTSPGFQVDVDERADYLFAFDNIASIDRS